MLKIIDDSKGYWLEATVESGGGTIKETLFTERGKLGFLRIFHLVSRETQGKIHNSDLVRRHNRWRVGTKVRLLAQ